MFRAPLHPALSLTLLGLLACGEPTTPSQPDAAGNTAAAVLSLVAAPNSWTPTAPTPYDDETYGFSLGVSPNSAGQPIVYTLGGTLPEREGVGTRVQAYNAATNTWTGRLSEVGVFHSNGVGKIGSRLYFSGGYNDPTAVISINHLWAYDYNRDRIIRKADLPIYSAEGVTGVIDGKLYVLPGACSGEGYPRPGFCAVAETRRFYRYDPATDTWVTRRQAPHFHAQGAAAVIDGKFYVVGGSNNFQPVADLDVYDPATNTWRTLAPIPTGGHATGGVLGGQFYVVVNSAEPRTYAYNRLTNQWKAKAAPGFFGAATRVTLDGHPRLFMANAVRSALYTP